MATKDFALRIVDNEGIYIYSYGDAESVLRHKNIETESDFESLEEQLVRMDLQSTNFILDEARDE